MAFSAGLVSLPFSLGRVETDEHEIADHLGPERLPRPGRRVHQARRVCRGASAVHLCCRRPCRRRREPARSCAPGGGRADSVPYQAQIQLDTPDALVRRENEPRKLKKAEITLNDCLACSGCITSAESVLVAMQSHDEVYRALAADPVRRTVSLTSDTSVLTAPLALSGPRARSVDRAPVTRLARHPPLTVSRGSTRGCADLLQAPPRLSVRHYLRTSARLS